MTLREIMGDKNGLSPYQYIFGRKMRNGKDLLNENVGNLRKIKKNLWKMIIETR